MLLEVSNATLDLEEWSKSTRTQVIDFSMLANYLGGCVYVSYSWALSLLQELRIMPTLLHIGLYFLVPDMLQLISITYIALCYYN